MSKWELLGNHTKIKTGKLDANASSENGHYPFFTCSKTPLQIDSHSYDCECVLVAGNGDLNVKYYEGKFDAYQRTYIVESYDKQTLDVKYLFYFLDKYVEKLREMSIGGVIKYIKLGYLTDAKIPLPPLAVQKKIVDTLDHAAALIEKRKAQIAKLDLLVKSQFIQMFGDPVTNPYGWRQSTIGESCFHVKDGPHVSPKYVEDGTGVPFISTRNLVTSSGIDWSTAKYISEADYEIYAKRCKPEKGDILYTKGGTTGIARYVDTDRLFANWVHLAVLKFSDELNGIFFEYMLNSGYCYQQSQLLTKGIANRDLVLGSMKQIKFFVPPRAHQDTFAAFVHATEKFKAEMQCGLTKLELLYKSLMQKCFNGDIL